MSLLENISLLNSFSQLLKDLINSNPEIVKDSIRLDGYLKDVFGSAHKKEIFLIVEAAKSGIIKQFEDEIEENSVTVMLSDIVSKFVSNNKLEEESAVWVTVLWAISLQKMMAKDGLQFIQERKCIKLKDRDNSSVIPISHDPVSNLVTVDSSAIDQIYQNGKKFHNQGNYAEAIRCYDKALLIDPQYHDILSDKGLSLHNQGNYAEAIRCYDKALLIDPHDEFIKTRRNNTIELVRKKFENMDRSAYRFVTSHSSNPRTNLSSIYIVGIVVVTLSLGIGIAAFAVIGSGNNLDQNSSIYYSTNGQNGSVNTTSIIHVDADSKKSLDQRSILTFADNIKQQIIANISHDKAFSESNTNVEMPGSYNTHTEEKKQTNEAADVNHKMDEFKLELERAMESNFDRESFNRLPWK